MLFSTRAQQSNPVAGQVENPITDTPTVNPLENNIIVVPGGRRKNAPGAGAQSGGNVLSVDAAKQTISGTAGERIFLYEGTVDVRIGVYRLRANKITVYEKTNRVLAEGNVVFDQEPGQRITGTRADWNYGTKLGYFENATGYTNQTDDGTILYFNADRVERVALNRFVIINGVITACDEIEPKWSFKAKRAEITTGDRVRLKTPRFRIKDKTVLILPFASVSIKKRDRASGFLTPTVSGSGQKGFRFSGAYYQTLGRSADVTFRLDTYSKRGVGFGADVRTRANSRSFLNFGFYTVKDRIFGEKESASAPDQGGSSFYINGVHYFGNGFLAAADVNVTSNLAFRQVFSDSIQQAISPEERSQVFVNKNFGDYSFNLLTRTQVTSLPNVRIRLRQLPSITLDKRPSALHFFEKLPVYFSFAGGLEGISRKETVENLAQFQTETGGNPLISPSIVQRLDAFPQVSVPFNLKNGWSFTATAGLRATYYSNSIDPLTRLVVGNDLIRGYGTFEFDVRPPALARNFRRDDGTFFFRHVIEPYLTYRKISGINNIERILRVDTTDIIADTNEIEFGVTNRFFTRRSTENVSGRRLPTDTRTRRTAPSLQPYEALSITVRGKYFFDPYFGGALTPGRRNQFYPINTFSGFSYGGVPRRFSPINIEARYRPSRILEADVRTDLDSQRAGLRNLAVSFGLNDSNVPRVGRVQIFQTFYYTRALSLAPSLARFADARGLEPGTQRGSQWSPSFFIGRTERGAFGGLSLFYDFQDRADRNSSLISSTTTAGYAWDCCAVTAQLFTFNVGLRTERRVLFSFRLNGIGTFGTEQIGQRFGR